MNQADFWRLEQWYSRATGATEAERAAIVAEAMLENPALAAELERMLAARLGTLDLSRPVLATGADLLAAAGAHGLPRIPGYKVLRRLGAGSMAIVYEGEAEEPRRRVAIKVLHADTGDQELLQRFRTEARILARLDHPNIARIHSYSSDGGIPYLVMEFISGRPLDEHARVENLPLRDRVTLLAKIAEGIHHAHQRGVVHRDLKPANLLVTADGNPRIVDFGIAKTYDSELRPDWLRTLPNRVLGTLAYMSPEQLAGEVDRVDIRTDVYALGVVAYELLTGKLPHDPTGKSLSTICDAVTHEAPRRPGDINSALRGDLEWIILKAIAKEPDSRYGSAIAFANDLQRYLNHEVVSARPPSNLYTLHKFIRRKPALASALLVLVVVVLGGLATTLHLLAEAREAQAAERSEMRRAIASGREARAVERVLFSVLNAPNRSTNGNPDVRLSEIFDHLDDQLATWNGPPAAELRLRRVMGEVYCSLQKSEAALKHATRALELAKQLGLEDATEGLRLRALHIAVLTQRAEWRKARIASEALLPVVSERYTAKHPLLWQVRLLYSMDLAGCGEGSQAQRLLEGWRQESATLGETDTGRAVEIRRQLAALANQNGDRAGAEAMLAEARLVAPSFSTNHAAAVYNLALAEERLSEGPSELGELDSRPSGPVDSPGLRLRLRDLAAAFEHKEFDRVAAGAAALHEELVAAKGAEDRATIQAAALLGFAYYRLLRYADARKVLEPIIPRASRLNLPECAFYRRVLGICLVHLGELGLAEPHLRQALAEMPTQGQGDLALSRGEAMAFLGRCAMRRNDPVEARKQLEGAIALLATVGNPAPRAKTWLRELGAADSRPR